MFFDKQMNQSICQSFVSLIYDTVDLKTLLNGSLTFHRLTIGWQLLKTINKEISKTDCYLNLFATDLLFFRLF